MMPIDVPYSRAITPGLVGNDVVAYKRAVSRAAPDLYPWPTKGFTPFNGTFFVKAIKGLQKRHKIAQTGNIGPLTHELLERLPAKNRPKEHAFDARSIQLLTEYYELTHVSPDQRIRKAMLQAMQFWYGYRLSIKYSQARPFVVARPPKVPWGWDCSGFATNVYYAAGALNPNGRSWDGLGYTGTLMTRGMRCDLRDMEIGDMIFYGSSTRSTDAFPYGSPTHVAVYNGQGMVYSLGSYPMGLYRYNYRGINHYRHYEVV